MNYSAPLQNRQKRVADSAFLSVGSPVGDEPTVNQRQIDVATPLCLLCLASISGRWRFEATLRFWYCCGMADCKVLAFLLCDKTTVDPQGRVTLHALFARDHNG